MVRMVDAPRHRLYVGTPARWASRDLPRTDRELLMPPRPTLDGFRTARPRPGGSGLLAAPRRLSYLVMGGMLSVGAPVGLAVVRLAALGDFSAAALTREVTQDLPAFLYVTVSTLAVFSAFGYVLERQADAFVDLARTDPLTGLRNPRAFEDRLA